MLKKSPIITLVAIAVLFFQFTTADPFQQDLLNYINVELPKVATIESEAIDAYSSVVGDNYTSDDVMYKKITEVVIPKYTSFSKQLAAIVPATGELKKIHKEYVKASQEQLKAFNLIADALQKQDANEIKQANAELSKAASLIASWKKDLLAMCKKHNITLD
jgi:hypothetical protein